jgi:hypothetical protein
MDNNIYDKYCLKLEDGLKIEIGNNVDYERGYAAILYGDIW